jgi:DHA1 family bicyclomycin/chloramphenicol resistance-like MFS transporter
MMMALAPAIAPAMGGFMMLWLPWPSIFIFLAVYGIAMIMLIQIFLGESLPLRQSLHPLSILANYGTLLRSPLFLVATFSSGFVYAGFLAYLASSSFVYIDMLGVPMEYFGFTLITSVIGYMVGSGLSARFSRKYTSEQLMLAGAALAAGAAFAIWIGASLLPNSIAVMLLPMIFYSVGIGFMLPNAMALALSQFPYIAGTASALFGFVQMSLSAFATAIVGRYLVDSPAPMLDFMLFISGLALLLSSALFRARMQSKS